MRRAALLLAAALLGGCATPPPPPATAPVHLLADARFAPPTENIDTSQLFALSPAMHEYIRSPRFREMIRSEGRQRGLIDALYKEGELQLDYDATATRPAAETFALKSGNCMSLVIMTAAFARELGYQVTFQQVRVHATWSRLGTLYMANTHVNVSLGWRMVDRIDSNEFRELYVVDFLPQEDAATFRTSPISETTVVAMYANNRAAEALAAGRVADAYWWAREALAVDPAYTVAYNTLGAVYQRHGDYELAENAFRAVLAREEDSRIALQNLLPVLEKLGKADEAKATRERLARLDPEPPFHFFELGRAAMDRRDFRSARDLFAREVERAPYYHEFHFWYALASLQLGETETARKQLALAQETSTTPGNRERYAAKLEYMRSMLPKTRRR